jgi:hypothetical protein
VREIMKTTVLGALALSWAIVGCGGEPGLSYEGAALEAPEAAVALAPDAAPEASPDAGGPKVATADAGAPEAAVEAATEDDAGQPEADVQAPEAAPACGPTTCPSGCCSNGVCELPSQHACGQQGEACVDCGPPGAPFNLICGEAFNYTSNGMGGSITHYIGGFCCNTTGTLPCNG